MNTRISILAVTAAVACSLFSTPPASAQIGIGADLYSRYIWRGANYGDSFSIQPALTYANGALEIGAWSSYSISADGAAADELDLYLSLSAGPVSFGVTDYHFPNGSELFNFDTDGEGAHYLEPFISYSGILDLYAAAFAYNDPATSFYIEVAKTLAVDGAEVRFSIGGTPSGTDNEPSIYGTSGPGVLVLGIGASKAVQLTSTFSLPISVTYIINPHDERSFLIFGVSI